VADAPGFFAKLGGILDPGGDPDAVRRAAAACRKLSRDLDGRVQALIPVATDLQDFWHGKDSDGFQRTWRKFVPGIAEYGKHLDDAAVALDRIADVIHEAQVRANHLKIAMAATAVVGIALTVVSFGASAAVGTAALEAEAGAFAIWLAETLGAEVATVEALLTAIETTTARFALGSGASAVATGGVKAVNGQNPLDPASWSADDVTHVLFDGALTVGVGAIADTTAVGTMLDAHPYLGAAAAAAARSGTASAIGQFWLGDKSITDLDAWKRVGISAGVAGVSGVGVSRAFNGNAGDLTRGLTGVPAGAINYALNFPQLGTPPGLEPMATITDLPGVPGPIGPIGSPVPAPAPNSGGSYHVRPGDSLWVIAGRRLGDPTLWPRIAEANGIESPYIILPNQRLKIPSVS